MLSKTGKLSPKQMLRCSEVGSEVVILDRSMGELLRLNHVAGSIWKQLNGQRSASGIAEMVSWHFAIDHAMAERDVEKFLKKLVGLEVVEARTYDDRG